MLQTTENQLTPYQIVFQHRKLITKTLTIKELTNLGKPNEEYPYLISAKKSPINVLLDIDYSLDNEYQYIILKSSMIYCKQFTNGDITAITNLYNYMIKNNTNRIPRSLYKQDPSETLKPGQLAEIITKYLNPGD